jgi:glutamine synthetase
MTFVQRHGLWSDEQERAAQHIEEVTRVEQLEVIRFAFVDQHGILRGKTLIAEEAVKVLRNGITMTTTLLGKDTSHRTIFPVFTSGGGYGMAEMEGGADFLIVPDPVTFKVLPWVEKSGWVLCDLYFGSGKPVPFSTRALYRSVLQDLTSRGFDYVAGLEVEFHVFKLEDVKMRPEHAGQPGEPPSVSLLSHGYQYLTEQRYDQMEPALEIIRRDIVKLGLPLRSVEVEIGPSQTEFTFAPTIGLTPADMMVLFRSAVKQICRRHGYHATFMCRPRIPNVVSSGWHLHQSLRRHSDGGNAFMSTKKGVLLSDVGLNYLGGLLAHARSAAVFSTPTINGYKRYRSYSLAPDRAIWGRDNRGVMLRVLGAPEDSATRIENRVGEPAANPYLYMASQVLSGLDGIDRKLNPGPSADTPYETKAEFLPKSLREALYALRENDFFKAKMGAAFIDYYTAVKDAEIVRYQQEVTEWEQREYFDTF